MYNIIKINTTIFRTSVLHYTCVTIGVWVPRIGGELQENVLKIYICLSILITCTGIMH